VSRSARLIVVAVAIAVAVAAFVIAQPGDDDDEPSTSPQSQTTETTTQETTQPQATTGEPQPPEQTPALEVVVRNSQPVNGVQKLTLEKGERIRLIVRSNDTSDEVHMHGYDVKRDLAPGKPARFDLPATIEGGFEVELEGAGVPIVDLEVQP
jgi:heme/copper-type cytochrome/quinol oxidase subunit 2